MKYNINHLLYCKINTFTIHFRHKYETILSFKCMFLKFLNMQQMCK